MAQATFFSQEVKRVACPTRPILNVRCLSLLGGVGHRDGIESTQRARDSSGRQPNQGIPTRIWRPGYFTSGFQSGPFPGFGHGGHQPFQGFSCSQRHDRVSIHAPRHDHRTQLSCGDVPGLFHPFLHQGQTRGRAPPLQVSIRQAKASPCTGNPIWTIQPVGFPIRGIPSRHRPSSLDRRRFGRQALCPLQLHIHHLTQDPLPPEDRIFTSDEAQGFCTSFQRRHDQSGVPDLHGQLPWLRRLRANRAHLSMRVIQGDANLSAIDLRVGPALPVLGGTGHQIGPSGPLTLGRKTGVHAPKLTAVPR